MPEPGLPGDAIVTRASTGVLQYLTALGGSAKLSPVTDSYELRGLLKPSVFVQHKSCGRSKE